MKGVRTVLIGFTISFIFFSLFFALIAVMEVYVRVQTAGIMTGRFFLQQFLYSCFNYIPVALVMGFAVGFFISSASMKREMVDHVFLLLLGAVFIVLIAGLFTVFPVEPVITGPLRQSVERDHLEQFLRIPVFLQYVKEDTAFFLMSVGEAWKNGLWQYILLSEALVLLIFVLMRCCSHAHSRLLGLLLFFAGIRGFFFGYSKLLQNESIVSIVTNALPDIIRTYSMTETVFVISFVFLCVCITVPVHLLSAKRGLQA